MALGGGNFVTQNKVLPGTYINFISAKNSDPILSDRGIATMPLELDWGIEDSIFTVTNEDFEKSSFKYFGYDYKHEKLKGIRDLFKNIKLLHCYRLTSGGVKASNDYATAKYCGIRGNDIKIIIRNNIDNSGYYDVITYLGEILIDTQTVNDRANLISNDYVDFKVSSLTLQEEAGLSLTGGTNGVVNGSAHQRYLDKIETYGFNSMGTTTMDDTIKSLYINFCKRLRNEVGSKFQVVIHNKKADYLGVINVKNRVLDDLESSLVYFVTGLIAGCPVNKSNTNKIYSGEFNVETNYTQNQLIECIKSGEFVFHNVNGEIKVLEDINSKVTVTEEEGSIFSDNQTIRVIDQISNDIAVKFNTKYLGDIGNDDDGRISLWLDIVKQHKELEKIRAIEKYDDKDLLVAQGEHKKSIVVSNAITIINTMTKLYMAVKVA